jgi:aminomethyltransferase
LGQTSLKSTPLLAAHQALNARMVGFGGWLMPIQYQGITSEHEAVRQRVGMFDISHMGKFSLTGTDVLAALQPLVPSDLSVLQPGQAKYTVLLNENGGVIDDLIIYYQDPNAAILIVNAATTAKDWAWFTQHLDSQTLTLTDWSTEQILLAVQGPQAIATLQSLTDATLTDIPIYWHKKITLMGQPAWVGRTGYTGEDGFEVMVPAATGQALWAKLLELGVQPCGLGARDTLRLEAAMALYGQDVTEEITPLEAGLNWLIHWEKGNFIGKQVLLQQKESGLKRQLVGLQMEGRNIARHDYPVLSDGENIGIITSGTFSPTLGYAIALAYVPPAYAKVGQVLSVEIRGKACPAEVVKRPFYKRPKTSSP